MLGPLTRQINKLSARTVATLPSRVATRMAAAFICRSRKTAIRCAADGVLSIAGGASSRKWAWEGSTLFHWPRPASSRRATELISRPASIPRKSAIETAATLEVSTFGECVQATSLPKAADGATPSIASNGRISLRVYAAPIRTKAVNTITTADVLAVLKPIWKTKPETASRVRGRIKSILDAARVSGHIPRGHAQILRVGVAISISCCLSVKG